ncbi:MAG: CHASE domain-containing protein [Pseudomonadota bacterium]
MDNAATPAAATQARQPGWSGPLALAALMLVLGLGLTWQLWRNAERHSAEAIQAEFDTRTREVVNQLALRVATYAQSLRGVQGLFASSEMVSRREFAGFVQVQDLEAQTPGLQAVGYIEAVPAARRAAHEARVRAEGFPSYAISPAGERALYTPVLYLEPFAGPNLRVFGFDSWSEPLRRRALEQARDANQPAMSGKLALLQDGGARQTPGFLIVLPVYDNALPHATLAQRRAAIRGWVFAPFRASELIGALPAGVTADLAIELYDGDRASEAARMDAGAFSARHAQVLLRSEQRIGIGAHRWTLAVGALPAFGARLESEWPRIVLGIGVAGSVILALLAAMLARSSAAASAALARARAMAGDLAKGQKRLLSMADAAKRDQAMVSSILDSTIDGILVDNGERRILVSNQRFRELWSVPETLDMAGQDHALIDHMVAQLVHSAPFLHSRSVQYKDSHAHRDLLRLKDGRYVEQFTRIVMLGSEPARLWSFRDITERKQIEQRERSHRHVLELLARGAPLHGILDAVVLGVEATNPGMLCSIMLLSADGQTLSAASAPSLPEYFRKAIDDLPVGPHEGACGAAAATGARVIIEDIQTHPDCLPYRAVSAKAQLASCWSQPIRGASGRVIGSFAIYHRSTHYPSAANVVLIEQAAQLAGIALEQAQAALALRAGEERFRSLYDNAPVALWEQDWSAVIAAVRRLQGEGVTDIGAWLDERPDERARLAALVRIVDVNGAALSHVGAAEQSALGMAQLFGDMTEPCFADAVAAMAGGAQVFSCDGSFLRLDGSARQHALTMLVMPGHAQLLDFVIVSTVDITERKRMDAELLVLATTDFLTGLPNRREFMARLDDELARVQRNVADCAAVLMLDIDHFKEVNDRYGHASGDAVLRHLAGLMSAGQCKIDTLGRVGGEEFAVLLPGASADAAAAYAERLRQSVADCPLSSEGQEIAVTVSIGIAGIYARDMSADAALKRADKALYRAKQAGRNRVDSETDTEVA